MVIMPGTTVFGPTDSEYEVLDFIGSGNFGMVHKVGQRGTKQVLAMKTVASQFTDQSALKAFINEGNLAVGIRHQNVIEYLFFHDGLKHPALPPYILMEYADGGTLQDQLETARQNNEHFSSTELLEIFKQLAVGMKAINAKLVHRDIKPDNILVSKGVLKISDFGLSKVVTEATRKSTFKGFGCMAYMAPEAWRFEKNTPQLDIYAMGMVFYELATLRHPFNIPNPDQKAWMEAHLYEPVPTPDKFNHALPAKLGQIILKMVEKDPRKRFGDWDGIQELLSNGVPPSVSSNSLIDGMLKRRLEQDSAAQAFEAKERQKKDEKAQFCKLVLSQATATLVAPLAELVDQFNREYSGQKASLAADDANATRFRCAILFPSARSVTIEFRVLLDEHFIREIPSNFQYRSPRRKVCIPTFQGRRVQGWGIVQSSDGRGFNVVLVDRTGEVYGEFLLLANSMGFPSQAKERPNPFAFAFNEIEHEFALIDATHIYSTKVEPFDANYLREFVASYV